MMMRSRGRPGATTLVRSFVVLGSVVASSCAPEDPSGATATPSSVVAPTTFPGTDAPATAATATTTPVTAPASTAPASSAPASTTPASTAPASERAASVAPRIAIEGDVRSVTILGDSIAAGWGERIADVFRDNPATAHIDVRNRSIPGLTLVDHGPDAILPSLERLVDSSPVDLVGRPMPDVVVTYVSVNEFGVAPERTADERRDDIIGSLTRITRDLTDIGVTQVLILPTPEPPPSLGEWYHTGTQRSVVEEIERVNTALAASDLPVVDDVDYGLDVDGDGNSDIDFYDDFESELFVDDGGEPAPDLLHPDEQGDDALTRGIAAALIPILAKQPPDSPSAPTPNG